MHIEVIWEVVLALFAVYGVFCGIQLVTELLFAPSSFTLAVFVEDGEPIEKVCKRISYAQLICARERGAKTCPVMIIEDTKTDEARIAELEKMGVEIYGAHKF